MNRAPDRTKRTKMRRVRAQNPVLIASDTVSPSGSRKKKKEKKSKTRQIFHKRPLVTRHVTTISFGLVSVHRVVNPPPPPFPPPFACARIGSVTSFFFFSFASTQPVLLMKRAYREWGYRETLPWKLHVYTQRRAEERERERRGESFCFTLAGI